MKSLLLLTLLTLTVSCGKKETLGEKPQTPNASKVLSLDEFQDRLLVKATCENGKSRITRLKEEKPRELNIIGEDSRFDYDRYGYFFEDGSFQLLLEIYKYSPSRNQITEFLEPILVNGKFLVNKENQSLELYNEDDTLIAEIFKPDFDNGAFLSIEVKFKNIPSFNGEWGILDNSESTSFSEMKRSIELPIGMSETCE